MSDPLDGSNKVLCPFHADATPSCSIYEDHYHCHGCGAHGSRLDWLINVEGMTQQEAIAAMADWVPDERIRKNGNGNGDGSRAFALELWGQARPIHGTIAARYLKETRGIDLTRLPESVDHVLRFHPSCVFADQRLPCLLVLMRDPLTDEERGIQRIALELRNGRVEKIERRMLGRAGVAKLWPAGSRLVVGEGLETVLAAATRLDDDGTPFTPAWATLSDTGMATLPVIPGVSELILLVDHDLNGKGQNAADRAERTWRTFGREVTQFMPDEPGSDFNDIVLRDLP